MQQQVNTGTTGSLTASDCPNLLPCGVCRLLMMQCPKVLVAKCEPTWQTPISPTYAGEII